MTRAEFLLAYGDIADPMRPDSKFARDLDALLAATRAEALEDAAKLMSNQRHRYSSDEARNALVGAAFSIRALVKP